MKPTLWRTCRALANKHRLQILKRITEGPGTVKQIAETCGLSVPQASLGLRALQSRGLLQAERKGRWVFYTAKTDTAVLHSNAILLAVTDAFNRNESRDDIVFGMTAFTHPRRIRIAAALHGGPLSQAELMQRTGCSLPALRRHLLKLRRRGLVSQDAHERYTLNPETPTLLRLLLPAVLDVT